jgi:hypothetical protein
MAILQQEQTFRQQVRQHTHVYTILPMRPSSARTLNMLLVGSDTNIKINLSNFSLQNFMYAYIVFQIEKLSGICNI